jgi:hypothetical protein
MKAYGGLDVKIQFLLTSALVEWSPSRTGRFTAGEKAPGTHWIGGWLGPKTGLDEVEKILDPTGTRTPTPRPSMASRYTECAIPAPSEVTHYICVDSCDVTS